jgi:LytS/YehU family sensor histidine kinase
VRHFGESLQASSDRDDLLERAEASLRQIFRSTSRVEQGIERVGEGTTARIDVSGSPWGVVRVLPRADEMPALSEDSALLSLLSRMLGFALENDELRNQKMLQQRREQELELLAARSELRALRAQINPHFLFNSLNTVAALIPREPQRAEQIIEQLSEIFRYAVRHSEREWVRVDEELLIVSAYLDIECARFGERLHVDMDVDDGARGLQIPAMVILTIAENAVKHGVAAVRGPGRLAVCVNVQEGCLSIRVLDSGPGFPPEVTPESLPEPARSGYGLRNVRERLAAYFGPEARMTFGSTREGLTEVALRIPLRKESRTHASAGRG